jgi:hypothetical protein
LQNGQHVSQGISEAVIAGQENGARGKLAAVLYPGSKFVGVNDVVVSFQKLELLPENLGANEAAIEKMAVSGAPGGNHAMISHDGITAGWHNAVEHSAVCNAGQTAYFNSELTYRMG